MNCCVLAGVDDMEPGGSREIQLDDDLAMTQTELNTRCPVTMKEMVKPVRNKHCGHSYDYDGAKQLIRNRQQARYDGFTRYITYMQTC